MSSSHQRNGNIVFRFAMMAAVVGVVIALVLSHPVAGVPIAGPDDGSFHDDPHAVDRDVLLRMIVWSPQSEGHPGHGASSRREASMVVFWSREWRPRGDALDQLTAIAGALDDASLILVSLDHGDIGAPAGNHVRDHTRLLPEREGGTPAEFVPADHLAVVRRAYGLAEAPMVWLVDHTGHVLERWYGREGLQALQRRVFTSDVGPSCTTMWGTGGDDGEEQDKVYRYPYQRW